MATSTPSKTPGQGSGTGPGKTPAKTAVPVTAPSDGFVSFWQRAYDRIAPYMTSGLVLLIGLVVVLLAGWGVSNWLEARRERATEQLGRAMRIAEAELLTDKDKDKDAEPSEDTPRFKTAKERAEAAISAVDQLQKDYGSTPAALRAKLVRAGLLYDQGRFADAEALYKEFLGAGPREQPLLLLAREGVGLCAESRGDLAAALAAYQELAKDGVFRERAMWDQARIYAKQGNKQKALEIYKDMLSKAAPTGGMRDDIQNRIAQLEP